MKLDLGLMHFNLPEAAGLAPQLFVAVGSEDRSEGGKVGPTIAKAKTQSFRRTLTIGMAELPKDLPPVQAVSDALNGTVKKVSGTVVTVKDRALGDPGTGKQVEFTHRGQDGTPLRTQLGIFVARGHLHTLVYTALGDKRLEGELREQFETVLGGLKSG
ncbi:MAG: hypothetical protein IT384_27285 [Deltaproteobacteria bacterium]|nr:hypothetical protein [Deltaproteobacteria bacterium]